MIEDCKEKIKCSQTEEDSCIIQGVFHLTIEYGKNLLFLCAIRRGLDLKSDGGIQALYLYSILHISLQSFPYITIVKKHIYWYTKRKKIFFIKTNMQTHQQRSMLFFAGIFLLLGTSLSGCGESSSSSSIRKTESDGVIRSADQYAVGITTDQTTYPKTDSGKLTVTLHSHGASSSSPFNGVQLFLHVPDGVTLSNIVSSDPNMTAKPPKDEGNNVFQVLLYGGNQTADRPDGVATLTFTITNQSTMGPVTIVNQGNRLSTITGDQNTNAHSFSPGTTLFFIQ